MWDRIVNYFQTLEQRSIERMAMLAAGLLLLWFIENVIPLIALKYKKNKVHHAAINLSFTALHLIIHTGLAVFIVLLSDWCRNNQFGLIHWLNLSVAGSIILCLFILDFFGGWLVHITEHKIKFLWRFHVVHHSDNNVDVTTGLRHHPIESVLRGLFFFMGIFICGAPVYAVMIYQTTLIIATQITHANISLPKWLDTAAGYLFVSPNMHKVHHHWKQPFTDSNYGAIFSLWDRFFGTLKKLDPSQIRYGLDRYYPNEKDEDFLMLMKKPFQQQDP